MIYRPAGRNPPGSFRLRAASRARAKSARCLRDIRPVASHCQLVARLAAVAARRRSLELEVSRRPKFERKLHHLLHACSTNHRRSELRNRQGLENGSLERLVAGRDYPVGAGNHSPTDVHHELHEHPAGGPRREHGVGINRKPHATTQLSTLVHLVSSVHVPLRQQRRKIHRAIEALPLCRALRSVTPHLSRPRPDDRPAGMLASPW
jgi:hypothetical protein